MLDKLDILQMLGLENQNDFNNKQDMLCLSVQLSKLVLNLENKLLTFF